MTNRMWMWGIVVVLGLTTLTWAQSGGQAPPAGISSTLAQAAPNQDLGISKTGELPSAQRMFMTSPVINGIIAGLSVIALLLFIYFYVTINIGAMAPSTFVDDVSKLIIDKKYEEAGNLCRANRRLFIASIIQRSAENAGKEHSVIIDMIDSEGRRRADVMWNRISYLSDVANVAPMLGLLGTVMGMIQTFLTLKETTGNLSSDLMATGIGGAMATTFFGLIVAILATVFYSITKGRATKALATVEQIVHSIVDHIKRGAA